MKSFAWRNRFEITEEVIFEMVLTFVTHEQEQNYFNHYLLETGRCLELSRRDILLLISILIFILPLIFFKFFVADIFHLN